MVALVKPDGFRFAGHAIVTADGMIADAAGDIPELLRDPEDRRLFQAALDDASVVVLGRKGHARHPNQGRKRLVLTASVDAMEEDVEDRAARYWNPEGASLKSALEQFGVVGGTVAVTGGLRVFDLFLPILDEFVLAEVHSETLAGGIQCFTSGHPRNVLADAGIVPMSYRVLTPVRRVTQAVWRR